MLWALLLGAGFLLWQNARQGGDAIENAAQELGQTAQLIAARQQHLLVRAELLLLEIGEEPALLADRDVGVCAAWMAARQRSAPDFVELGLVSADGRLLCAAAPPDAEANYSGRDWFSAALALPARVVNGAPVQGKGAGRAVFPMARAQAAGQGRTVVAFAAVDQNWFERQRAAVRLPDEAGLMVMDDHGRVVLADPGAAGRAIDAVSGGAVLRATAAHAGEQHIVGVNLDGVPSVLGVAELATDLGGRRQLVLTLAEDVVLGNVRRALRDDALLLVVCWVLTAGLVMWGTHRTLVIPLRRLMRSAEELGMGQATARRVELLAPEELGAVEDAFDDSAERMRRASQACAEAERSRIEATSRLQLMVDHAPAALALFDRDMRYLACSRRWLSDFELGDQNLTGRSHYEVFPHLPESWKAMHRRGLAGEVLRSDADRLERADGRIWWLRWELRPWCDAQGQIGGLLISSEDITALRQALDEHNTERRLAQTILDTLPDAVWLKSAEGRYLHCNRRFEELVGRRRGEIVGTTDTELFGPGMAEFYRRYDQRAIEAGTPQSNEERLVFKSDGHQEFVETIKAPVRDSGGGLQGVLGIARNITRRRAAEIAVRDSDAFKLSVLEAIRAHIAVLDHEGVIVATNGHWRRFAEENAPSDGQTVARTGVGTNYLKVCDAAISDADDLAARVARGIRAVLAGSEPVYEVEYPCHSDTEARWFRLVVTPLGGGAIRCCGGP